MEAVPLPRPPFNRLVTAAAHIWINFCCHDDHENDDEDYGNDDNDDNIQPDNDNEDE